VSVDFDFDGHSAHAEVIEYYFVPIATHEHDPSEYKHVYKNKIVVAVAHILINMPRLHHAPYREAPNSVIDDSVCAKDVQLILLLQLPRLELLHTSSELSHDVAASYVCHIMILMHDLSMSSRLGKAN
jgi:hypothetical protein